MVTNHPLIMVSQSFTNQVPNDPSNGTQLSPVGSPTFTGRFTSRFTSRQAPNRWPNRWPQPVASTGALPLSPTHLCHLHQGLPPCRRPGNASGKSWKPVTSPGTGDHPRDPRGSQGAQEGSPSKVSVEADGSCWFMCLEMIHQ